jgi:hypothetical protein
MSHQPETQRFNDTAVEVDNNSRPGARPSQPTHRPSPEVNLHDPELVAAETAPESPGADGIASASPPSLRTRLHSGLGQPAHERTITPDEPGVKPEPVRVEPVRQRFDNPSHAGALGLRRAQNVENFVGHG